MERRGRKPASLQRADRLQRAEDADGAVVAAGVRYGVDVRAAARRRGSAGSDPIQRAKVLPTASSRMVSAGVDASLL